jgi:transposase
VRRRANALVLLDDGLSCEAVAKLLFVDDDTIQSWRQLYEGEFIQNALVRRAKRVGAGVRGDVGRILSIPRCPQKSIV